MIKYSLLIPAVLLSSSHDSITHAEPSSSSSRRLGNWTNDLEISIEQFKFEVENAKEKTNTEVEDALQAILDNLVTGSPTLTQSDSADAETEETGETEEIGETEETEEEEEEEEETPSQFITETPRDNPPLPNPHTYTYLHRPIPPPALSTPPDVRTNTLLIEGVSTGVRTKVPPLSEEEAERYGKWMFFDGYREEFGRERPVVDFGEYEGGDCPTADFPGDAWQSDAVYMMHFLDNAQKLIDRAREAIYEEYGFPVRGPSEERDQALGFRKVKDESELGANPPLMATEGDFDGLVRRLLHAMMTNAEFKVALSGHSVAAGHDSNFWQSYIHQFHHVMEPIFTRLGMKLSTYNYGRGGLGTFQDTLAGTTTLGDPDVLIWDSGMTEREQGVIDAFYRQAILSGTRVPFFINDRGFYPGESARFNPGVAKSIRMTPLEEEERESVPWAVRYLNCEASEMSCNKPERKFNRGCWDEGIGWEPPTKQKEGPYKGQHPSWRQYQLTSRKLALIFVHALEEAVDLWQENTVTVGMFPLDEQFWHVSEHYANIRREAEETLKGSACMTHETLDERLRKVCQVAMRGRTEFTGRANPDRTSLRTIIRPAEDGYAPTVGKEVVYDLPITIAGQAIPEGQVDVRAIVGAGGFDDGVHRRLEVVEREVVEREVVEEVVQRRANLRSLKSGIVPGKGWELQQAAPAGYCDGSTDYHSCKRDATNDCLAYDHHDTRTGVFGDSLSGWLVFDIDHVVEGFIVVKFESWHKGKVVERTKDWETVDGGRRSLSFWPEDFEMDVSVDGVMTTYDWDMLEEMHIQAQRVVEVMVLRDEKPKKPKDMEVAIRLRCGEESQAQHLCNINISHLYWA